MLRPLGHDPDWYDHGPGSVEYDHKIAQANRQSQAERFNEVQDLRRQLAARDARIKELEGELADVRSALTVDLAQRDERIAQLRDRFWTDDKGYETCQNCGNKYDAVWAADDKSWTALMGGPSGLLCPGCFHRKAFEAGIRLTWCANGEEPRPCR